jgi:phosphatidylinositol alpha-mannosyltransferase
MLAGVPAVLSDIPPLLEMSQNGEFARIFPTGDASALASRMIELAQNKDARTELARCAQRFARAEFSIEAHLARLKLLYNSL